MGFLLRYLTVGLIGTLAIYYGAPYLKPSLPPPAQAMRPAPAPDGARYDEQQAPVFPDTPREPAASRARPIPPAPPPTAAAARAPVTSPAPGYTPATQRIPASGRDITHWGVTLLEAPVYERDGKRRDETLPGGTLVEQTAATTSSRGEMALCRIWHGSQWYGPYLIATADLIRFAGGRDEVSADDFDSLALYTALHARVDARTKELQRRSVDANPHAAPLRQLKQRYDEAAARAKFLTQTRDNAQGNDRIRTGDELRQLKEDEAKMRRQLESLTRQYEDWKQRNGAPAADPARDPQVQALTAQMEALRPRLGNFGL